MYFFGNLNFYYNGGFLYVLIKIEISTFSNTAKTMKTEFVDLLFRFVDVKNRLLVSQISNSESTNFVFVVISISNCKLKIKKLYWTNLHDLSDY